MFMSCGIDALTLDQVYQLFSKETNPSYFDILTARINKNSPMYRKTKMKYGKSFLKFEEFRDALISPQANEKFRNIMRQIRKKIVTGRLETTEDIVYLPMSISKMISFILERT